MTDLLIFDDDFGFSFERIRPSDSALARIDLENALKTLKSIVDQYDAFEGEPRPWMSSDYEIAMSRYWLLEGSFERLQRSTDQGRMLSEDDYFTGKRCIRKLYLSHDEMYQSLTSPDDHCQSAISLDDLMLPRKIIHHRVKVQCEAFPGAVDLGMSGTCRDADAGMQFPWYTSKLLRGFSSVTICDAAIVANGFLVLIDVVVKNRFSLELFKVTYEEALTDDLLEEAALAYVIARKSTWRPVLSFSVLLRDESAVTGYMTIDVTDEVKKRSSRVEQELDDYVAVLELPDAPEVAMGSHCDTPNQCQFKSHCQGSNGRFTAAEKERDD